MEIVNFANLTWQEIPEQDNPAFQYIEHPVRGKSRPSECIIIFKGRHNMITDGGIVVAHIPLEQDITKKGVFWRLEEAEKFAELLAG
jgi:hypothetical protein